MQQVSDTQAIRVPMLNLSTARFKPSAGELIWPNINLLHTVSVTFILKLQKQKHSFE